MARWVLLLSTTLALAASTASAEDEGRKLRLLGKGAAPAPASFVIDAEITKGYEPLQSEVSGWFAALPPETESGEVSGSCVEDRCVLNVSLEDGKLSLTGDFAKPGATALQGRAILTESYGDEKKGEAAVSYTAVGEDIPGLGRLAPEGAVSEHELARLVVWAGGSYGFNYTDDGPPGDMERDALGRWQAEHEKPGRGLILVDQLAELRRAAAEAHAKAQWTAVEGKGWKAGYPAALLSPAGPGRYAGAGGTTSLTYEVTAPVDEEAWDAMVEAGHAETDGRSVEGYTRVNDDFEVTAVEGGVRSFTVYHRRKGGVAKMVLSYPNEAAGGLDAYETILTREFDVSDEVAP
jgi:hypothetical protein